MANTAWDDYYKVDVLLGRLLGTLTTTHYVPTQDLWLASDTVWVDDPRESFVFWTETQGDIERDLVDDWLFSFDGGDRRKWSPERLSAYKKLVSPQLACDLFTAFRDAISITDDELEALYTKEQSERPVGHQVSRDQWPEKSLLADGDTAYNSLAEDAKPTSSQRPIIKAPTPGRNDPCSCGSGKKYKKCCGA